ncbi:MAG: LasA protease [Cellvibrionaceae bacterium]|jgi:LasA protease
MIVMKITMLKRQNRCRFYRFFAFSVWLIVLTSSCNQRRVSEPVILATAVPLPTLDGMKAIVPTQSFNASDENSNIVIAPTISTIPAETRQRPTTSAYTGIPTPDLPHYETDGSGQFSYTIAPGDTLFSIAIQFGLTLEALMEANDLTDENFIAVGQTLGIPAESGQSGPNWKIIPDSELVYGPTVNDFQTGDFLRRFYPQSTLLRYQEQVEGQRLNGAAVIDLVAIRFSINPRLLLAMTEYRTHWVSRDDPLFSSNFYPMGFEESRQEGLYNQLSIAANLLNFGFYGRAEGGLSTIKFKDESRIVIDPRINDGSSGVQVWLAGHTTAIPEQWELEVGPEGFYATYENLFGNPFGLAYEQPLVRPGLEQPPLNLPWEPDVPWYFTGGPHGGWAAGSSWAALDFGPDKDKRGCYVSEAWIVAAADGVIVYSDFGGVLLDLDGDGDPGTGWVLFHWHVDPAGRIDNGTTVQQGDRIGHPSCEGGFSNGTHMHFARRFNGYWIAADGEIPFVLEGWVSSGAGNEYDGYLTKGEEVKEACVCAEELNELVR